MKLIKGVLNCQDSETRNSMYSLFTEQILTIPLLYELLVEKSNNVDDSTNSKRAKFISKQENLWTDFKDAFSISNFLLVFAQSPSSIKLHVKDLVQIDNESFHVVTCLLANLMDLDININQNLVIF